MSLYANELSALGETLKDVRDQLARMSDYLSDIPGDELNRTKKMQAFLYAMSEKEIAYFLRQSLGMLKRGEITILLRDYLNENPTVLQWIFTHAEDHGNLARFIKDTKNENPEEIFDAIDKLVKERKASA